MDKNKSALEAFEYLVEDDGLSYRPDAESTVDVIRAALTSGGQQIITSTVIAYDTQPPKETP